MYWADRQSWFESCFEQILYVEWYGEAKNILSYVTVKGHNIQNDRVKLLFDSSEKAAVKTSSSIGLVKLQVVIDEVGLQI